MAVRLLKFGKFKAESLLFEVGKKAKKKRRLPSSAAPAEQSLNLADPHRGRQSSLGHQSTFCPAPKLKLGAFLIFFFIYLTENKSAPRQKLHFRHRKSYAAALRGIPNLLFLCYHVTPVLDRNYSFNIWVIS